MISRAGWRAIIVATALGAALWALLVWGLLSIVPWP